MERRAGRVVVIGAGLAGLGAAWRLSRLGFDVRVLEREARAGGRAASVSVEGFRFEPAGALLSGADRELLAWVDELGLRDELLPLRPAVPAQVYRGRVSAIDPRGLFGVAAIPGVRRLQAARLVRLPRLLARYRAQLEQDAPERAAPLDDRSLHDFGRLYFGSSVVERWMAPFAGPLGASPDTSRALFLRRYHAHAEAFQGLPRATLAELAEAVASRLMIQTGVEARCIERVAAGGLRLFVRERGYERTLEADAVVVATGAPEAARVAAGVIGSAERESFARVRYAPALAFVLGCAGAACASAMHLDSELEGGPWAGGARARRGGRTRAAAAGSRTSRPLQNSVWRPRAFPTRGSRRSCWRPSSSASPERGVFPSGAACIACPAQRRASMSAATARSRASRASSSTSGAPAAGSILRETI
jgi:oxygen-dependent protoporphyrinogen oxidase